ncbi:anthranilate phosphoribosyltransferase [Amycolatopsis sp. 195334CR]|uniref:anthranilate phosphoribosyltransferase n=1 Tax=Amycolatopsis sp. 195334CR TaxID=2814588 RepID=UPI001A8E011E|nr:anthranilate phosphoribosyltransferase [Amycolatopsis sp. 195334CR]MBN6039780.1 anthranilate phosphoribosyltransferase [Amycolatopsis sp. 195334CR]
MIEQLGPLARGQALSTEQAADAMRVIMSGEAGQARIAGFAMALAARGETVDEITGMALAAREFATPLAIDPGVLDTCGTGGDGLDTFNISTTAAIVAAACGVPVAKHGNRSVSSACGSADVLEELGVRVDLGPAGAAHCLRTAGITFLYAPVFHPAFRHAAGPRRELGVRTVFNLLGPLCNPANAEFRTVGVPSQDLVAPMAEVLGRLGVRHALVFHSEDGMDELSTAAPAVVAEVTGDGYQVSRLDPAELGLAPAGPGALTGGDKQVNAEIIRRVLGGETGPARDVVLLNAAAALKAAERAAHWAEGLDLAARALDSGAAGELLENWTVTSWHAETEEVPA